MGNKTEYCFSPDLNLSQKIFCTNGKSKGWELSRDAKIEINKKFVIFTKKNNGKIEMVIKNHNLTNSSLRTGLKKIEFRVFYEAVGGKDTRNEVLENRKIPPFSYMYYLLFAINLKIPTPKELVSGYLKVFCEHTNSGNYTIKNKYRNDELFEFSFNEIAARICRAYNSFNRELELLTRFFEDDEIHASYSFERDYFDGIDISVEYQNTHYGVVSFQRSKNAEAFRRLKESFRHDYSAFNILSIAISGSNSIMVGDIMLYSDKAYSELINTIKKSSQV